MRKWKNQADQRQVSAPTELAEWRVIKETRLGILCGTAEPTEEQDDIATKEADEWLLWYKAQEKADK